MPNWVFNTLAIEGSEEQIQKVKAQLNAPYERRFHNGREDKTDVETYSNPVIAFWNICRPPEDKLEEYEGVSGYVDGEKKGDTPFNWYNFNNREWGTKWDIGVSDSNKFPETELYEESATHLSYRFNTAWSPPLEVIEKLSLQYPELEITLEYEEEGGWGGEIFWNSGGSTIVREWDSPDSHADYVEQGKEDSCPCQTEENEEYWHSDCPSKKLVIEVTCVKDVEVVKSAH